MCRKQPIIALILLGCISVLTSANSGCRNTFRRSPSTSVAADELINPSFDADSLWKQGYGYSNPNSQRIRDGLDPVNFDGRTDKERNKNLAGDLLGTVIGGVAKHLWNGIRK